MFGSEEKDKFMEMVMKTTMEVVSKTTTEIIKNIAPHMGTNTNSFNTNNNFNINLFLNEQCANALSIQDFAKKLTLTMQDLATLKDYEPKAIQGIIKNNLKSLTITERPMHNHVDYTPQFGAHIQSSDLCGTCHTSSFITGSHAISFPFCSGASESILVT